MRRSSWRACILLVCVWFLSTLTACPLPVPHCTNCNANGNANVNENVNGNANNNLNTSEESGENANENVDTDVNDNFVG